jgi:histidinol dehydrogenase
MRIRTFRIPSPEAEAHLRRLAARGRVVFHGEAARVAERALSEIRRGGDPALARWRRRHDGVTGPPRAVRRPGRVSIEFRRAFEQSLSRVTLFHSRQATPAARVVTAGSRIEERVFPLDSVGVYIPGGRAIYVSTALMTILPARLAGVPRIAVATPPSAYDSSPELRYVLERLGVTEVYRMGGAHAIAALALGTGAVPPVACIVGPGNRFVAAAKRLVSGLVRIDGVTGPTEVAIYADGAADPESVAADLLAQAEHDRDAAAVLVTTSASLAERVEKAISRRLPGLGTRDRARAALSRYGAIAIAKSPREAVRFLEAFAPEHLGIQTRKSLEDVRLFRRAGAIFAGRASSEVFGDYIAGTNHVLPTNGTARFASALSVRDFVRRMAVVSLSRRDAQRLSAPAEVWARIEGLPAHAAAARLRRGNGRS